MSRIENAAKRLKDVLRDAEVVALPANQLLVQKNMVDNPAYGPGNKATKTIPGNDGYEIYAAVRENDASRPQQAQSAPMPPMSMGGSSISFKVDLNTKRGEWESVNADGETVVIRANAGSFSAVDEVNQILAVLKETLL
jgi:hypothetical protein